MNSTLFWRVALLQTALVGGTFLIILLLPFGGNPLTDWGVAIGPVVWVAGSLATGTILALPLALTIISAVAGGAAGALIGVSIEQYGALPIAIGVFAASCSGYDASVPASEGAQSRERPRADAQAAATGSADARTTNPAGDERVARERSLDGARVPGVRR